MKSDSGLAEGEIWFIEGCEITFWCVEKLESASRYEMRADIKTLGRNVDLVVEVVDVMAGRDAGAASGYLHRGEFMTFEGEDEQRLLQRFHQINPEIAPREPVQPAAPRREQRPPPSRLPSTPPPRRDPESTSERVRRHPSSTRSRGASERRVPPPTPGERRRLRKAGRMGTGEVPQPPLSRVKRDVPDIAPGNPLSVMVRFQHREVMQADALLRGDDLWLFVGCHPLLTEGEEFALFIQLPAGNVVQLRARVAAARRDHCVLESRHLHAALLANLRAALGV